ncbi:hypothetical protein FE697_021055 [Mumia zhuanghuii]|uniref:Uncharacterized protein n=2 Tax=Mumia TaxID=1546255 RepID=A0ABW1QIC0_9ACTN|nr:MULTISPECIES: hypothetical protein [Mumia]KAA1418313.1 hypothetical protein FE697_021055 [Mumia zhuanghuii]
MIVAGAVCPAPPLLLPELAGQEDVGRELREVCVRAVTDLLAQRPDVVVVVTVEDPVRSPSLPQRVAEMLLSGALDAVAAADRPRVEHLVVPADADTSDIEKLAGPLLERTDDVAILVLAEGSARRTEKAPGHLDPRASAYDEVTRAALETPDPAALLAQDVELADALLAAGHRALVLLAAATQSAAPSPVGDLRWADDPFGVMYFVVVWSCAS